MKINKRVGTKEMCWQENFNTKYRYLGPEWLQIAKNQIDLWKEIPSAPTKPKISKSSF